MLARPFAAPVYARYYWYAQRVQQVRRERAGSTSVLKAVLLSLCSCGVVLVASSLPACFVASLLVHVFSRVLAIAFIVGFAALCALPGLGAALVAGRINRAIARARARRVWGDLLLLPYPRHEIVVYSIVPDFSPGLLTIALFWNMALAFIGIGTIHGWWSLVIVALLIVESVQLAALSVAAGIALARSTRLNLAGLLLFGAVLTLGRAGIGLGLAGVSGLPDDVRWFGLSLGPLGAVAPAGVIGGALVAVSYVLGLEMLVRVMFAWGVEHAGEVDE